MTANKWIHDAQGRLMALRRHTLKKPQKPLKQVEHPAPVSFKKMIRAILLLGA